MTENEKSVKKAKKTNTRKLSSKVIFILSLVTLFVICIIISLIIFFNSMHTSIYETPSPTPSKVAETITLPPSETTSTEPVETQVTETPAPTPIPMYKPQDDIEFLLLFGLAEYDLADTIWIGIVNKTDNKIDFLSIPRDTYLRYKDRNNPDHWKINSYYNNYLNDQWLNTSDSASSMYLMGACEALLNIDMDYYVRVSYDTIEKIVDSMGGIEYDVPFRMEYYDLTPGHELIIEIDEGLQVLNGENVVKFLRFRQGTGYDYISDIARINRQQDMVKTIIKKAFTLSNISAVIEVAKNNIRTNFGKDQLTSFITFSLSLNSEKISFHTLRGYEDMVNTQVKDSDGNDIIRSFYIYSDEEVRKQLISICE
jgi:LCP family protein required for cell wall assembly